jgi:hypothetical protein
MAREIYRAIPREVPGPKRKGEDIQLFCFVLALSVYVSMYMRLQVMSTEVPERPDTHVDKPKGKRRAPTLTPTVAVQGKRRAPISTPTETTQSIRDLLDKIRSNAEAITTMSERIKKVRK